MNSVLVASQASVSEFQVTSRGGYNTQHLCERLRILLTGRLGEKGSVEVPCTGPECYLACVMAATHSSQSLTSSVRSSKAFWLS